MAWQALTGTDYSVGEVVTASKMNTYISGNLRYLHGDDGAVAIGNTLTATAGGSSTDILRALSGNDANYAGFSVGRAASEGRFAVPSGATQFLADATAGDVVIRVDSSSKKLLLGAGAGNSTLALTSARAGVNQNAPQGPLHVLGSSGRWLMYDFSIANNTTVVVIPDGTGDVASGLQLSSIVRGSGGIVQVQNGGGSVISPGGSAALYSNASDILTLRVLANGQLEIQRIGGTLTYVGAIWGQWI